MPVMCAEATLHACSVCAVPEDVRASMRSYMLLRFNAEEEHREARSIIACTCRVSNSLADTPAP